MLVPLLTLLSLTACLGVLSALQSALSTIRGSATASADVYDDAEGGLGESSRQKVERLIIGLRVAWSFLFAVALVVWLGEPYRLIEAGLSSVLSSPGLASRLALAASVAISVLVVVLLGDVAPAYIGTRYPEEIASRLTRPVSFALRLLGPVPRLLQRAFGLIGRRGRGSEKEPVASEADIRHLVHEVEEAGVIEQGERELINRVFNLGDRPVSSLMTPRSDVICFGPADTAESFVDRALACGLSCFPVRGVSEDEIIGTITIHDLVVLSRGASRQSHDVSAVMAPTIQAPESMSALQLLELLRSRRSTFAVVVDEHGGFAGVATLTDVLEVLIGDLKSNSQARGRIVSRSDGSILVDAGIDVDELFDFLALGTIRESSNGEFRSLGGFVMSMLGHVPVEGQHFDYNGFRFEVVDMDGNRIDKVLVSFVGAQRAVG